MRPASSTRAVDVAESFSRFSSCLTSSRSRAHRACTSPSAGPNRRLSPSSFARRFSTSWRRPGATSTPLAYDRSANAISSSEVRTVSFASRCTPKVASSSANSSTRFQTRCNVSRTAPSPPYRSAKLSAASRWTLSALARIFCSTASMTSSSKAGSISSNSRSWNAINSARSARSEACWLACSRSVAALCHVL